EEAAERGRVRVERHVATKITARREGDTGARDDDGAHVGRFVRLREQPPELGDGVLVDRVALFGPLQRQHEDATAVLFRRGDVAERFGQAPDPSCAGCTVRAASGTKTGREPSVCAPSGSSGASWSRATPSLRATSRAPSGRSSTPTTYGTS